MSRLPSRWIGFHQRRFWRGRDQSLGRCREVEDECYDGRRVPIVVKYEIGAAKQHCSRLTLNGMAVDRCQRDHVTGRPSGGAQLVRHRHVNPDVSSIRVPRPSTERRVNRDVTHPIDDQGPVGPGRRPSEKPVDKLANICPYLGLADLLERPPLGRRAPLLRQMPDVVTEGGEIAAQSFGQGAGSGRFSAARQPPRR